LQKARQLAESHGGIPPCMALCKMYAFMFIWNLASRSAMQPATLKFYVHHAVFKCEKGTDVIVKETWHAD